jgi:hypothetical protein
VDGDTVEYGEYVWRGCRGGGLGEGVRSEGGETEDISKLTEERKGESGKEEVIEYLGGGGGGIALTQMPD